MIQDDPINHKSTNLNNGMDYLLLSNESEEDIPPPFQAINSQQDNDNKNSSSSGSKDIYYKFALLIGLCKQIHICI